MVDIRDSPPGLFSLVKGQATRQLEERGFSFKNKVGHQLFVVSFLQRDKTVSLKPSKAALLVFGSILRLLIFR